MVVGGALLFIAALLPSESLLGFLRDGELNSLNPILQEKLLWGTYLFRLGLGCLGVVIVVISRATIWGDNGSLISDPSPDQEAPQVFLISALLLIGLGLRLYGLNLGLWFDEIAAYVNYVNMPLGVLITTYDSENQHFLYTILAHICVQLFGDSAWSVRLPAVGFGVGSLLGVYLLGREVFRERVALLATALLTFSYHHIWFSQNARGYTGVLFFSLLSSWVFLWGMRTNQVWWWISYAGTVALGAFTHITMIFVVASHFLMYLITILIGQGKGNPFKWLGFYLGFLMSGLMTFLLHALVFPQVFSTIGQTTAVKTWNDPFWTLLEFMKGMQFGIGGGLLILILGGMILTVAMWSEVKKNPFPIGFLVLPGLLGTLVVVGMGHPLWPRFFFFLAGFAALVIIRGLMLLGEWMTAFLPMSVRHEMLIGTILSVGLVSLFALSAQAAYAPKQDYKSAMHYVESHKVAGDAVIAVGLAEFPYKEFYKTNWSNVKNIQEFNDIRLKAQRTWVVFTMPMHLQAYFPAIMETTKAEFSMVKSFPGTLGDGTVYVYRYEQNPSSSQALHENMRSTIQPVQSGANL